MARRSRRLEPRRLARRGHGVARRRGRPPGRATGAETRDRIIDAAVKLFSENGYGSTAVRDIAERARVRVSTLYHYFRSKEMIYAEAQERVEKALRDIILSCFDQNLELRDLVCLVVERLFDFLREHRDESRLAFDSVLGRVGGWRHPSARRWIDLIEGVLRPAAARGAMKEIDPALFIISLDAILHWHVVNEEAYRRILGSDLRNHETAARAKRHIAQLVLRGVGVE
jgi:AcrR family transcriptional regulator